jgi:hypothetical protein
VDNFAPVLAAGGGGKKADSRIDLDIIVSSLCCERYAVWLGLAGLAFRKFVSGFT